MRINGMINKSEQAVKTSNPGLQQVRRFKQQGKPFADMIYNEAKPLPEKNVIVDPLDNTRRKRIPEGTEYRDLLVKVFEKGKLVYDLPPIAEIKKYTQQELDSFHRTIKRFTNPHSYPVGLERGLYELKTSLALKLRGASD